ncbi:MAG: aminotransferase [Arenicella sp.]
MSNILYPTSNPLALEQVNISHGKGIYLYDDKGKQYIEGLAGLWCSSLGYGNDELIETMTQQMERLSYSHLFGGKTHQLSIDLADKLSAMVNVDKARVFFGNSGSDANDSLLKMVHYYNQVRGVPEKRKIISRKNAYHGVTMAAATLTGIESNHRNFNLPFDALGVLRVDAPHYYRNGLAGESEGEFCDRLIAQLEEVIEAESPDTIAAFIAEPIMGAGGVIVPPEGYFARIQQILKDNDILFLDDEVICAFGRTGNDFGATTFGFQPDTMTLAKGLSSAYFPISASVISDEIHQKIVQGSSEVGVFGHGYTYSGHPVGCAAALKTLQIYERDKLYEQAADNGVYMHNRLAAAFAENEYVGQIRGVGLIAGIQFVADKEKKVFFSDNSFVVKCQKQCEKNGLILRALADSTLAICPPLIITKQEIDDLVDIVQRSVEQVIYEQ